MGSEFFAIPEPSQRVRPEVGGPTTGSARNPKSISPVRDCGFRARRCRCRGMTTPDGLAPPPCRDELRRAPRPVDRRAEAPRERRRAGHQKEQARTGALLLRRSARRAARQDAPCRRRAGGDGKRRHHDDDAACQGHRAQDGLPGVHPRRRLRHGGDAGRRRFPHGRRPGHLPRAALGAEHWLASLRHLLRGRQAGAVLDAADSAATPWRSLRQRASISSPGSRSNSISSSWRTRGLPPRMRPGRRGHPR